MKIKVKNIDELSDLLMTYGFLLIASLGIFPIFTSFLNVPVNPQFFLPLVVIIFFILLYYLFSNSAKFNLRVLILDNRFETVLLCLVLVGLFISRVLVVINSEVPILHDPVAHAIWAKSIVDQGLVSYFYSPFLHSISATLSGVVSIPKSILLATQLASFLIPLVIAYAVSFALERKQAFWFVFLLTSIFHFPANLYYLAGKNALVLGILVLGFVLYFLFKFLRDINVKNASLLSLALLVLFFSHYPLWGITLVLITPKIIFEFIRLRRLKDNKDAVAIVVPVFVSSLLATIWFMGRDLFAGNNGDAYAEGFSERTALTFSYFVSTLRNVVSSYIGTLNLDVDTYMFAFVLLLLILAFIKDLKVWRKLLLAWLLVAPVLISFTVSLLNLKPLNIINITMEITYPLLVILIVSIFWSYVVDKLLITKQNLNKLFGLLFVIFFLSSSLLGYKIYKNSKIISVDRYDKTAFEYINKNLPADSNLLNSGKIGWPRLDVVYPVDGGMWIPVYTHSNVAISFLEFASKETIENQSILQEIIDEKNDDSLYISKLKKRSINYIYIDEGVYGYSLQISDLNNIDYEILFNEGPVKILKL